MPKESPRALHSGRALVDVEAARSAVHTAESQVALEHWKQAWAPAQVALFITQRDFLPGEGATWVEEERRQLAEVALRAMQAYAVAALGSGGTELPAAVRTGRRLAQRDQPARLRGPAPGVTGPQRPEESQSRVNSLTDPPTGEERAHP